jgi:hypothetical protein
VSLIDGMKKTGYLGSIRLEYYQGKDAEAFLVDGIMQEKKYQEEIEAQANN